MSGNLYIRKHAEISPCGLYRYMLRRIWDHERALVHFIMLNPSTADAERDDPTIRRCMGFAQQWNYGGIYVSNLFAYRTPNPEDLQDAAEAGIDPIGPECDRWIMFAANAPLIIAAWGAHPKARDRAKDVIRMFPQGLRCLGHTKEGYPRHPLYVKASQPAEGL